MIQAEHYAELYDTDRAETYTRLAEAWLKLYAWEASKS